VTGALDTYQWFHLKLDMLLQPNGDITLQVFRNDLIDDHTVDNPHWVALNQTVELVENDPVLLNPTAYSGTAEVGAGFGCQLITGLTHDTYIDWVRIFKSA
jgi:hypothetical protein